MGRDATQRENRYRRRRRRRRLNVTRVSLQFACQPFVWRFEGKSRRIGPSSSPSLGVRHLASQELHSQHSSSPPSLCGVLCNAVNSWHPSKFLVVVFIIAHVFVAPCVCHPSLSFLLFFPKPSLSQLGTVPNSPIDDCSNARV